MMIFEKAIENYSAARKKHYTQELSRDIAAFSRLVEQMTADGRCRAVPCEHCPVRLFNDIHPDKAVLCHQNNFDKIREIIATEVFER